NQVKTFLGQNQQSLFSRTNLATVVTFIENDQKQTANLIIVVNNEYFWIVCFDEFHWGARVQSHIGMMFRGLNGVLSESYRTGESNTSLTFSATLSESNGFCMKFRVSSSSPCLTIASSV